METIRVKDDKGRVYKSINEFVSYWRVGRRGTQQSFRKTGYYENKAKGV